MILCQYISIINVVIDSPFLTHVRNVEDVVLLILYSLMAMSLSVFLQECFQKGMILRRYYVYLNYLFINNRRLKWQKRKKVRNAKRCFIRNIVKPMGLCVYCQNVWLTIALISILTHDILSVVLCIGISNYALTLHNKYVEE